MINNTKLDKGKEIIYTFKVKAESSSPSYNNIPSQNIFLTKGKPIGEDRFNGVILSIENTPGSWYLETLYFFSHPSAIDYDTMSINGEWRCTNWIEIMNELKHWVHKWIP